MRRWDSYASPTSELMAITYLVEEELKKEKEEVYENRAKNRELGLPNS